MFNINLNFTLQIYFYNEVFQIFFSWLTMVASAHLKLLMFHPIVLIPAVISSDFAIFIMYLL